MLIKHAHSGDALADYRARSAQSAMAGVLTPRRRCSRCGHHAVLAGGRLRPRFVCARCLGQGGASLGGGC